MGWEDLSDSRDEPSAEPPVSSQEPTWDKGSLGIAPQWTPPRRLGVADRPGTDESGPDLAALGEPFGESASSTGTVGPSGENVGATPWPEEGGMLGEFRLEAMLGKGARGRVFLATQPALADRPVVLKVTPRAGSEHLTLARLQHPNIVPLYWAQDLPVPGLRILCMPYLGGATLARLLDLLGVTPGRRSGRDLLTALDLVQAAATRPAPTPVAGPARAFLARASYERAACWIGASLADALHAAHGRGLLHLDVKPSNILMAADGTPMLLDFHLARGPIRPDDEPGAPRRIGGTPPYMAPEQRAAMAEAARGGPAQAVVDGRADTYALGVLILEMLAGRPTARGSPTARRIRRLTGVGLGLADLLARCLAADPRRRYPDAGAVAADLRRHLADLPLRGVGNRSPAERWRKWRRRHPDAPARLGTAAAVAAAAVAIACVAAAETNRRLGGAEAALAEGRNHLAAHAYPAAERALGRGLALTAPVAPLGDWLPRLGGLRRDLGRQFGRARRARGVEELHQLADHLRLLYGTAAPPAAAAAALGPHLRAAWEARGRLLGSLEPGADAEVGDRLRADLLDLGILWADLQVRLEPGAGDAAAARRRSLATLDEAEACFGPSPVLDHDRRALAAALGLPAPAGGAPVRAARTAWEHYALGRSELAAGAVAAAAAEFERAVDLRPQDLWAQLSRGVCAYRLGRYVRAAEAFDVCVALAPNSAGCYANRARARAALGHAGDALRDFDRALRLDPTLGSAALDRGVLRDRLGRHEEAIADYRRALIAGADPTVTQFDLALARLATGDRPAALEAVQAALRADPGLGEGRRLERLLRANRPTGERELRSHRDSTAATTPISGGTVLRTP